MLSVKKFKPDRPLVFLFSPDDVNPIPGFRSRPFPICLAGWLVGYLFIAFLCRRPEPWAAPVKRGLPR